MASHRTSEREACNESGVRCRSAASRDGHAATRVRYPSKRFLMPSVGILAASGFIIKRMPNAQSLIDKIAPYQGWIGIVMFGWGIWETLHSVLGISLLAAHPLTWI